MVKVGGSRLEAALVVLSLVVATAVAAGCGGGGGGGGGGNVATGSKVSGKVVAGPVSGATVRVYRVNPDRSLTKVAEGTTSADGTYTLTPPGDGPFLLVATGGSFKDEATGQTRSIAPSNPTTLDDARGSTLEAFIGSGGGSAPVTVSLTPLSTFASRRVAEASKTDPTALTETGVQTTNRSVGRELGLGDVDPRGVTPLDITDPANASAIAADPSSPAAKMGAVLAGLSQQAKDLNVADPLALVEALAKDFSDGSFNGKQGNQSISTPSGTLPVDAGTTGLSGSTAKILDDPTKNASGTTSSSFGTLVNDLGTQDVSPPSVNRAPAFNLIPAQTVAAGAGQQTITIQGVTAGSGEDGTQTVTLTATSSNSSVVANPTITGSGTTRTLTYAPLLPGTGTVTVTAQDSGGVANGGVDTVTRTFTITVTAPLVSAGTSTVGASPGTVVANGVATTTITVTVRDGAGNPVPNQTVTLVATGTNNVLVQPAAQTNASGQATGTLRSTTAEAKVVTATVGGSTVVTQTASVTFVAGPATQLTVGTQPANVVAGTTFAAPVTVAFRDAFGNVVPTTNGVSAALTNPGGATLSGTTTVPAVGGIATFGNLSLDRAANGYSLRFSATGLPPATSNAFNVAPGAAVGLGFTTQPTNAGTGANVPAFQVAVLDALGNVVTSAANAITVALGANPGGSTLSGTLTVNAVNGVATFTAVSLDNPGSGYTLDATATGLAGAPSAAFNVAGAGTAARLVITVQPTNTTVGAAINLLVEVQDAFGSVVPGAANTVTAFLNPGQNPASATLGGATVMNAVNGVAAFSLTIDRPGQPYGLGFSSPGLSSAGSALFSVAPGAPAQLQFTVQPTNAAPNTAIVPSVQVAVQDSFGNVVTTSTATVMVSIGTNPSGGTLAGTATVNASAGLATFPGLAIDNVGTGYTLLAGAAGLTTATSTSFNVSGAGSPAKLAFTAQPQNAAAGAALAPSVQVAIQDAAGNATVSTATVTLALASNPGGATLSGTLSVAAVNGVATFPGLSLDRAGASFSLAATSPGLTGATSNGFDVTAGAAARVRIATEPSNVVAGAAITPAVVVNVEDALGNVVPNAANVVTVALGTNPAGATLSGATSKAAVNGVASFGNLSVDRTGVAYVLSVTSVGLVTTTSATFDVAPAPPVQLAFMVQPATIVAGAAFTPAPVVEIRDTFGNRTNATGNVTLTINFNAGGGTLLGTTTVNAVAGQAAFPGVSIDKTGVNYTLAASFAGVPNVTSTVFDVTFAAASQLGFSQQPTNVVVGATITPAVAVEVRDAFGNRVTSSSAPITVVFAANPGGGTLSGTTTVAATAGLATFANLSIDRSGIGYVLSASTAGLSTATSTSFDVSPGAATKLAFVVPPTTALATSAFSPAVTVAVQDALGNVVSSNAAITLAIGTNPAGGTLAGTTVVNAVAGVAAFPGVSIAKAGVGYTLTASAAGLTGATSGTFDIQAGPATRLTFLSSIATTPVNLAIPAFQVAITDEGGNVITGRNDLVTVGFGVNPSGNFLNGTTSQNAVNGVATFGGLSSGNVAAPGFTFLATAAGLTPGTSAPFALVGGSPLFLNFRTQPTDTTCGVPFSPTVEVEFRDAFNNVSPVTSTITMSRFFFGTGNPMDPPGTLNGTTSLNAVAGVATFTDLSIDRRGQYTLQADAPGLSVQSNFFFVSVGPPAKLTFLVQPSDVETTAPIFTAIEVAITDAGGLEVVTSATNAITLGIGNNPGNASFVPALSAQNAVAGVTTFVVGLSQPGVGYTLTASAPGLTGATSVAFNVGPQPWRPISNGLQGAAATNVVVDPTNASNVYCATECGIFRSTNAGATWTPCTPSLVQILNVNGLAHHPTVSGTLWATTQGGSVLKTTDGGVTWRTDSAGGVRGFLGPVAAAPSNGNRVYVAELGIVWRSDDAGETWTNPNTGAPYGQGVPFAIAIHPTDPDTLYTAMNFGPGQGVWQSTDGGVNWAQVNNGLGFNFFLSLAIDPVTPTTLYLGTAFSGTWKTVNAGGVWTVSNTGMTGQTVALAIDPQNPATLIAVTDDFSNPLYRTTDGGASWSALASFPIGGDPKCVSYASSTVVYVGLRGSGVQTSTNGGTTWSLSSAGMSAPGVLGLDVDPITTSTVYAATFGSGVSKSTNNGATWTQVNAGLPSLGIADVTVDPVNPAIVFASGVNAGTTPGLFRSTDGGASWSSAGTGLPASAAIRTVVVAPSNHDVLYAGQVNGGVFKTTTGSTTCVWAATATITTGSVNAIVVHPTDPNTVYVATDGDLYKSIDGGASWTSSSAGLPLIPTLPRLRTLAISRSNPNVLFVVPEVDPPTPYLFKSTDGGATWNAIVGGGLPPVFGGGVAETVAVDPTNDQIVYLGFGGSTPIFKSTDGGATWEPKSKGLAPCVRPNEGRTLRLDSTAPNVVYFGTANSGVFRTTTGGE